MPSTQWQASVWICYISTCVSTSTRILFVLHCTPTPEPHRASCFQHSGVLSLVEPLPLPEPHLELSRGDAACGAEVQAHHHGKAGGPAAVASGHRTEGLQDSEGSLELLHCWETEGRCHLCLKWATLVSESWVGQRQSLCQGCGAWGPPNSSLTESLRVLELSHGCSEYSQCPDMAILSSHNVLQAVPRTWNLPTGILNTHNVLARLF